MPEDDHDSFALAAQQIQPAFDQLSTNPAALLLRQHGHRRQGDCGNLLAGGLDPHATEKDVSGHSTADLRDKRSKYGSFVAQAINKIGFIRPAERRFIDKANLIAIVRVFGSDNHAPGRYRLAAETFACDATYSCTRLFLRPKLK